MASSKPSSEPKAQTDEVENVERVLTTDDNSKKDVTDLSRVDKEVQQYTAMGQVEIDEETDKRLRRMIDRRVLVFMIATYFLQAIDKGTLSFTSIMGIQEDNNLVGQQVTFLLFPLRLFLIKADLMIVQLAHNLHLHCGADCRISNKLDPAACTHCQVSGL